MMKTEMPKPKPVGESMSEREARLAEEAKLEQERLRAEGNRIDDTQTLLDNDTRRRVRRFGQAPGGTGAVSVPGSGSTGGDLNIAAMLTKSLFSGGSPGGVLNIGTSGRVGGLMGLV